MKILFFLFNLAFGYLGQWSELLPEDIMQLRGRSSLHYLDYLDSRPPSLLSNFIKFQTEIDQTFKNNGENTNSKISIKILEYNQNNINSLKFDFIS